MTDAKVAEKWTIEWQQYIAETLNDTDHRLKAVVVFDEVTVNFIRDFAFVAASWSSWDALTEEPHNFSIATSYQGTDYMIEGKFELNETLSIHFFGMPITHTEKEYFVELLEEFPLADMLLEFQPNP